MGIHAKLSNMLKRKGDINRKCEEGNLSKQEYKTVSSIRKSRDTFTKIKAQNMLRFAFSLEIKEKPQSIKYIRRRK